MCTINQAKPRFNLLYMEYLEHLFNSIDCYLITPSLKENRINKGRLHILSHSFAFDSGDLNKPLMKMYYDKNFTMKAYTLQEMHKSYKENIIQEYIGNTNTLNNSINTNSAKRQSVNVQSFTSKNINHNQSGYSFTQQIQKNKRRQSALGTPIGNAQQQLFSSMQFHQENSFEILLQSTFNKKESDIKFKKITDQQQSFSSVVYNLMELLPLFPNNKEDVQLGNMLKLFEDVYQASKFSKETNYALLHIKCSKIKHINRYNYTQNITDEPSDFLMIIEGDYIHMNECMNDMLEFTETMCGDDIDEGIISTVSSRKIEDVMMNYDNSCEYEVNELREPNEKTHKNPKAKKVIFSGISMKVKAEKYQNGLFVIHEKNQQTDDYLCEFIPVNNSISRKPFTFRLNEIKFFLPFRFLFQYKAINLFFFNKTKSTIIQFEDKEDFTFIFNFFNEHCSKADKNYHELKYHTNLWVDGLLTNYDYLMYLNNLSGRSVNDLSQYPILPWTLVNFKDDTIDLNNPKNFRDLSLPIGLVNPDRLEKCQERYNEEKYFFRNYISFPFVIYFFLMRTQPLFFLRHQGGTFNPADRTFFSLENCWNATYSKLGLDLKELIPEFYDSNGDFLKNIHNLKFGTTQNGLEVNNVILPPWAKSPLDFVRIMRSALECEIVSNSLHLWIDLVFGFKAKGTEAINSNNLYYHLRYEECYEEVLEEPEDERQCYIDEIIECGQVPIQLFSYPHPKKRSHFPLNELSDIRLLGDSNPISLEIFKQKRYLAVLEKKYEKERRDKNAQTDKIMTILKEKEETYNQQLLEITNQANAKEIEFKAYVASLMKMNQQYRTMFAQYQNNKEKLVNEWIEKIGNDNKKKKEEYFKKDKQFFEYLMILEKQIKKYEGRKDEFDSIEKDLEMKRDMLEKENKEMITDNHEKSKLIRSYPVDIKVHLTKITK